MTCIDASVHRAVNREPNASSSPAFDVNMVQNIQNYVFVILSMKYIYVWFAILFLDFKRFE